MRFLNSPHKLFWIGAACVVLGFALPLMLVLGLFENSILLSFFIYILQLVGFILGVISTAGMALKRRNAKEAKKSAKEEEQETTPGWME